MSANKKHSATAWVDPDDAPDLSGPEWAGKLAAAPVVRGRGRPVSEDPRVQITLRLERDIVEKFKATGKGWQTRINEALKKADPAA